MSIQQLGNADGSNAVTARIAGFRTPCSSETDQEVVLISGFLSEVEIEAIERTPTMGLSIEAGSDGKFPGLVGGDRYRDENGLSIFGNASHRSWRIERSLEAIRPALNARLAKSIVETDIAHWNSLQTFTPVQHILEVEYIEYDGAAEGPPPKIEPHVDNGAKVTIIALLSDERIFDGGLNYFGGGRDGEPRTHQLKRGDALFFRGEEVEHWISPVHRGARAILQVEMHVHENRAAAEAVSAAAAHKTIGNRAFAATRYDEANARYAETLGMLLAAEEEHGACFGAHLEVQKMEISMACLLNQGACALKLGDVQRALDNCSAVLDFNSHNPKALFRRSQAYAQLGNKAAAEQDAVAAAALRPEDKAIAAHLADLRRSMEVAVTPPHLEGAVSSSTSTSEICVGKRGDRQTAACAAATELLQLVGGDFATAVDVLLVAHRQKGC